MSLHTIQRRPARPRPKVAGHPWGLMLVAVLGIGCRPADQIHSYTLAKQASSPSQGVVAAEPTDRMLAAILPSGERAWFFKVVGPAAAVDAAAPQVTEFLSGVRIADGDQPPPWQLPDGWSEKESTGIRSATIVIPTSGKALELTVMALPWTGDPSELLSNVNRWRAQMSLAPVELEGLAECTRELKTGDATMTMVDLRGVFSSSGMTAPFVGDSLPSSNAMAGSSAELPADHPPIDSPGEASTAPLQYTAPESWQKLPASGIRKAAFHIVEGEKQAIVTVIDFPATAGPALTEPLANVNRWRAEVGLDPIREEQLPGTVETISVGGASATYLAALPESSGQEPAPRAGTLAAMVISGDRIWFFKLTGDRELVARQQDQFRSFLESVRFSPAGGASDGN